MGISLADDSHRHEESSADHSEGGGYFDSFEHSHFSRLGTPIVHSFGVESAFAGRGLFADYRYRSGDGFTEREVELELEWAFTNRLGIIV